MSWLQGARDLAGVSRHAPVRHCPRPYPPHDATFWARGITGPEHSAEPGGAPEPCPEQGSL